MSKISNFEWGALIGVAVAIDIFQILLDLAGVGIFINSLLDLMIGVALQRYFKFRGVKGSWKQWISWLGAPALEFFTASIFPLGWVLEVIITMLIDKAEGKVLGSRENGDQNKRAA